MGLRLEIAAAAALTAVALWGGPARGAGDGPAGGAAPAGLPNERDRAVAHGAGGGRGTFVVRNATGAELPQPRFEFVLFDSDGLVDRLTTFDFGALPEDKTSVRQFDLAGAPCEGLGRLLVNGPAQCGEAGAAAHCRAALSLSSRTEIALIR